MSKHLHTILSLGDSYTIGESVPLHESFPYQLVQLLRKQGLHFHAPEIVARTGWTSSELGEHILHTQLNESYDFVTLLIGVNNQYRGLPVADFTTDFQFLLRKAIHFTGGDAQKVFVLSIPDWGVTPFAKEKDAGKIGEEIDAFNSVCEANAKEQGAHYLYITDETRKAATDEGLLAQNGLHYSGMEHQIWAQKIAALLKDRL